MLTPEQNDLLLKPIATGRVARTDQGQSHLEVWDVRRWLNRIFGFGGWSENVVELVMLYEQSKVEDEITRWRAAYRATVHLTIHDTDATYTEAAVGTNFGWLPDTKRDEAHDMAIKTAASQALKRCAINLGDQFGLSLYNNGSTQAVVGWTVPQLLQRPKDKNPTSDPAPDPDVVPADTDPTVEPTPEPVEVGQTETQRDPSTLVDQFTDELEVIADITDKRERAAKAARVGIAIKQAELGKHMTRHTITLDALLDNAVAGKPWKKDTP